MVKRDWLRNWKKRCRRFMEFEREMTLDSFFAFYNHLEKNKNTPFNPLTRPFHFHGVYVLENQTLNKIYVGRSDYYGKHEKNPLFCIYRHFSGNGHPDIYREHQNGHKWQITLVFQNPITDDGHPYKLVRRIANEYDPETVTYAGEA